MIRKADFKEVVRGYLNGVGYFVAIENLTEDSSIYSNIKKLKIKKGWIYRIEHVKDDIYELIDFQYGNSCLTIVGEKLGEHIFEHYLRLVTTLHEEIYAYMEQSFTKNQLNNLNESNFEFIYLSNEEVVVKLRYMDLPLLSDYSREYVKNMVIPVLCASVVVQEYRIEVSQQSDVRTKAVFDFNEELAALAIYHEGNIERL
ncbi:hypothetical protein ABD91_20880 [Lysinibacillus sphaericus]|uniref:hypothetical protein n=1 Tax=Lysinibacillus sphaericus TaxID=1421 RepID=UPI0018CE8E20|nr:hypothetical protein [Lysinibacillus sphaericus]MBG9693198.1 hypothetical protein [Lysinibacillus sphaericus]